jgi:hypothetical protein
MSFAAEFRMLYHLAQPAQKKDPSPGPKGKAFLTRFFAALIFQGRSFRMCEKALQSFKKARGGAVSFKWSHNNKFVSVVWEKAAD